MTKNIIISVPNVKSLGGAERYAIILAQVLAENSEFQVYLASQDTTEIDKVAQYYDADLSRVKTLNFINVDNNFNKILPNSIIKIIEDYITVRQFKKYNPELFFECGYKSEIPGMANKNYYICHFPHQLEVPVRSLPHKLFINFINFFRKVFLNKGKVFYYTYDVVIANSHFTKKYIKKRWGINSSVIEPPCAMAKNVDTISSRRKNIINVGRFEEPFINIPHKSQHVLLETFIQMEELHADGWELHLVGTVGKNGAAYFEKLRRTAEGYPVKFYPNASYSEMQLLLKNSFIYWHAQGFGTQVNEFPETQEHFGITTVEAMSAGLIPVVINSAGPQEVVNSEDKFTWSSSEELISKTYNIAHMRLSEQHEMRLKMVERAHKYDLFNFTKKINQLI